MSTQGGSTSYYRLRDLLERPELLHPPPVVVPRLAWRGRLTLFAAPEKSGKSTLLGQAVAALAEGQEFLGDPVEQGVTLWLALDEPLPDLVRRLAEYGASGDRVLVMTERPDPEVLKGIIKAEGVNLVVIDTATEFVAGIVDDLNAATGWQPLLRALRGIAQETGSACVLLHHTNKSTGRYRDSSQLGAGVDAILEMSESSDDKVLRRVRARGRMQMANFTLRFGNQRYDLDEGELPLEVRIYRVIEAEQGIAHGRLRKAVGGGSAAIDAMLHDLVRKGAIVDRGTQGCHSYFTRKPEHLVYTRQEGGKDDGKAGSTWLSAVGQRESNLKQGLGQADLAAPPKGGGGGKGCEASLDEEVIEREGIQTEGQKVLGSARFAAGCSSGPCEPADRYRAEATT
jgi:hypothetical protein